MPFSKTKFILSKLLSILLILLLAQTYVSAQYVKQQIDNSSGLSSSVINRMFQDRDNLLWIATPDGLNMYDGTAFHVFNYEQPNNSNAIASNIIYQISEDRKHNIWLATAEGVTRYHKPTAKFFNYILNGKSVPTNGYFLGLDSLGHIYAARINSGEVSSYDAKEDRFKSIYVACGKNTHISKIAIDGVGKLWLLENGTLNVYIKKKNGFYRHPDIKTIPDVDNLLYTNHTVFYTDKRRQLFSVSNSNAIRKIANLPDKVRSMTSFGSHYVLAWSTKGIGEYDSGFNPVSDIKIVIPALSDMKVNNLIVGQEQMLWCGTDGSGIIKVFKKKSYFKSPDIGNVLNKQPVTGFAEVNGKVWVATKRIGILCERSTAGPLTPLKKLMPNFGLKENAIYVIKSTINGLVYIGSEAKGIYIYDSKNDRYYSWESLIRSTIEPEFGSVHAIFADSDGSVWLGSYGGGLTHLKLNRNQLNQLGVEYLKNYRFSGNNLGPGNDVINAIEGDDRGNIWIGCRFGGLSVLNKKTGLFRTFKSSPNVASLSNNDVLSLLNDHRGKLWIGTSYGLNYTSAMYKGDHSIVFTRINVESGLPNNTIHAIEKDKNNNIWISTNKGVASIDPADFTIRQFTLKDGLQGNEFSDNAIWSGSNDKLYFGGLHGASYFVPQKFFSSGSQSNLLITELKVAGVAKGPAVTNIINLRKPEIRALPIYSIGRDESFFELRVNTIQFSNQEKCQYKYFLEGNDKEWHSVGEDKRISYNNLQPGEYTLMLRWSNGGGAWTGRIPVLRLFVSQYFWLTWPAFTIYLLVSVAGVYLVHLYRKNKLDNEHKLSLELALRKKDEELHRDQLDYFTNIAHELQTPLTIITGTLERYFFKIKNKLNDSKNENLLFAVNEQASRLNYLVYQLLEFRKAEDGYFENHFSHLDVSALINNIAKLFNPLAEQRNIGFSCYVEPAFKLWTDKDKLEKVIFNLLSNAIKHSGDNQQVVYAINQVGETLEIIVANSGCKLTDYDIKHLFSKFFVADSNQQTKISTGLGLAFTRQLVGLLGGHIAVTCTDGWITFKVSLQMDFVPQEREHSREQNENMENPSHLLSSIISENSTLNHHSSEKNNKQSLLKKLEGSDKKSILIVEDEPAIMFLVNDILKESYLVYEATNGREALELIDRIIPDLIVSDIMMPDMTGLEICNRIKNLPNTCHIPFLILSARGTIDQQIAGYEAGADAYIAKPFNIQHLLVRIKRLLEYHGRLHDFFRQASVIDTLPATGMKEDDRVFLEKTIALIEANFEREELDAQFLEKGLGMSKAYFYRRLKTLSNMTPGELIKKLRLQRSAALLQNTHLTVAEIFYRSGFNNQSHFFREFKKQYNLSPNDYRLQFKMAE